jgi:hypothetical protein
MSTCFKCKTSTQRKHEGFGDPILYCNRHKDQAATELDVRRTAFAEVNKREGELLAEAKYTPQIEALRAEIAELQLINEKRLAEIAARDADIASLMSNVAAEKIASKEAAGAHTAEMNAQLRENNRLLRKIETLQDELLRQRAGFAQTGGYTVVQIGSRTISDGTMCTETAALADAIQN